jgi:hypothetical protein
LIQAASPVSDAASFAEMLKTHGLKRRESTFAALSAADEARFFFSD